MSLLFERPEESSWGRRTTDTIILPGTRERMKDSRPATGSQTKQHWHYTVGYDTEAKHSNRNTGCSIMLNKNTFRKEQVMQIRWPPQDLAGRADTLRITSEQFDVACLVAYYPPRTYLQAAKRDWRTTCTGITTWLRDTVTAFLQDASPSWPRT